MTQVLSAEVWHLMPLFAGILTLVTCLYAEPICRALGLLDYPDGVRKNHTTPTPTIGGVAIVVPIALWCGAFAVAGTAPDVKLALVTALCGGGVALVGLTDDQSSTSPESRISLLFIFSAVALSLNPALLSSTVAWGFIPPSAIPGWAFASLAIVSLIGLANAANMVDGMNGLALALYLVWSVCLALVGPAPVSDIATALAVAVLVTLLFNSRGGIFLGDCGTYGISFVVGLLTIQAHNSGKVSLETILVWFYIPVLDCLRLMGERALRGRAPWQGDTNHFHHKLSRLMEERWALLVYGGTCAATSLLTTLVPPSAPFCLFVLTAGYVGVVAARPAAQPALQQGTAKRAANVIDLDRSGTDDHNKRG